MYLYIVVHNYFYLIILNKHVMCTFIVIGYDRKEKMNCAINPQMDKWEMSLMNSLNFSQLFLHLITLGIFLKIIKLRFCLLTFDIFVQKKVLNGRNQL